jgi:hypothetical protein
LVSKSNIHRHTPGRKKKENQKIKEGKETMKETAKGRWEETNKQRQAYWKSTASKVTFGKIIQTRYGNPPSIFTTECGSKSTIRHTHGAGCFLRSQQSLG